MAAELIGVHEVTVRTWRTKSRKGTRGYKGFDDEVKQALAEGEAMHIARISAAGKTNWRASAWLLERMYPDKWGPPPPPPPIPDGPPVPASAEVNDLPGL